jgi:hypothetical protein
MPVPGRKLHAAPDPNAHSHGDSYGNSSSNTYTNGYGHINTYSVAATFSHGYCDIHAHAHEYSNANSNSYTRPVRGS